MALADLLAAPSPSSCQYSMNTITASLVARTVHRWSVVSGQRWGNVANFSLARGFNSKKASRINTYIRNSITGEEFHLGMEASCTGTNMGLPSAEAAASIISLDEAEASSSEGTPKYLWQHKGCPGRYNKGCFRMPIHQGQFITCTASMPLQCNLKDASSTYQYRRNCNRKLTNWTRLPTQGNTHLIAIACTSWKKATMNTDKDCWLNGVLPQIENACEPCLN